MPDRLYCHLEQVRSDLGKPGESVSATEESLVASIQAASDFIDRELGMFIPFTETRKFDGTGQRDLQVDPMLGDETEATVIDDGDTLTSSDVLFYPRNRYWENGPFTRIAIDPDASGIRIWTPERDIVSIASRWGKYENTITTGETITQADATTTVLTAANAANISPGMVLLIETEQELVQSTGAATDSTGELGASLDANSDVLTMDDGSLVNVGEVIQIGTEDMRVLKINTNEVYVERSWNGTQAADYSSAVQVNVYRTFVVKRGINGTTAAAHAAKAASRYIPPSDVNWLCRQIAGLMIKKAQTSFAGKTANIELGEVFYLDEFPNKPISKIRKNYRIVSL